MHNKGLYLSSTYRVEKYKPDFSNFGSPTNLVLNDTIKSTVNLLQYIFRNKFTAELANFFSFFLNNQISTRASGGIFF